MTSDDEFKVETQQQPADVADLEWFNTFLKHLKFNFVKPAESSIEPESSAYAAVRAFIATIFDGTNWTKNEFANALGISHVLSLTQVHEWNEQLASRRFDLIDKQFQGLASPSENLELIGLDALLRRQSKEAESQAFGPAIDLLERSSEDVEEKFE
jgi:hypothetical protein